jgi:hypothetical protein
VSHRQGGNPLELRPESAGPGLHVSNKCLGIGRQIADRGLGERDEIDRMAPTVGFLAAERGGEDRHDRRQTTATSRPSRVADATRLKPEAQMNPVFMLSAPG